MCEDDDDIIQQDETEEDEHTEEPTRKSKAAEEEQVTQWEADMRERADANSGVVPTYISAFHREDARLVRLPDSKPTYSAADTEALLNGLIEDCRFLIREVVFHSARLTPDAEDRLRFLASAKTLAVTGAKLGRAIAELRGGNQTVAESRHRMIVEHVRTVSQGEGVGEKTP